MVCFHFDFEWSGNCCFFRCRKESRRNEELFLAKNGNFCLALLFPFGFSSVSYVRLVFLFFFLFFIEFYFPLNVEGNCFLLLGGFFIDLLLSFRSDYCLFFFKSFYVFLLVSIFLQSLILSLWNHTGIFIKRILP